MPSYKAIWAQPGQPSRGNVSFEARGDYHASQQADRIAREIDCVNTPRTLMQGFKVVQVLNTGVNKE